MRFESLWKLKQKIFFVWKYFNMRVKSSFLTWRNLWKTLKWTIWYLVEKLPQIININLLKFSTIFLFIHLVKAENFQHRITFFIFYLHIDIMKYTWKYMREKFSELFFLNNKMNKKARKRKRGEKIVGVSKIVPSKIFRKWSMLAGSSKEKKKIHNNCKKRKFKNCHKQKSPFSLLTLHLFWII